MMWLRARCLVKRIPPTVSRSKLIERFDWLKNNGYTPVSWKQIKEAEAGKGSLPEKPVLLTFDDGYLSFCQTVFPLLQQYTVILRYWPL